MQSIKLVAIAVNVFIAETRDLSLLMDSYVLMLLMLMLGFTGESDRFRQVDRKTMQNKGVFD